MYFRGHNGRQLPEDFAGIEVEAVQNGRTFRGEQEIASVWIVALSPVLDGLAEDRGRERGLGPQAAGELLEPEKVPVRLVPAVPGAA